MKFKISGSLITSKKWKNYPTGFMISLDHSVSIKESFYPPLSISELFSEMGGSIGLWLGIGLLQICLYFMDLTHYIKSILLKNRIIE